MTADDVARLFHETYERLAPDFGYETRTDSAVSWESVPEPNKSLMIAVAEVVLARVRWEAASAVRSVDPDGSLSDGWTEYFARAANGEPAFR